MPINLFRAAPYLHRYGHVEVSIHLGLNPGIRMREVKAPGSMFQGVEASGGTEAIGDYRAYHVRGE